MAYNNFYHALPNDRPAGVMRFKRTDAEELTNQSLEDIVREAGDELKRRALKLDDVTQAERKNRQSMAWRGFSNFLLGAAHALSAHRSLQRHTSNFGQTFQVGSKFPVGNYWTAVEIGKARRAYAASAQRDKDKKLGLPYTDIAPWERTTNEYRWFALKKLELEKQKAPPAKPVEPINYFRDVYRSYTK